ncbi:methionyl-tRNA formyltransferase [Candidatus Wolfebacteria bacterium]|nr:methionyl-tRNA formyltransferase [Candidatus Wolfebacteria bacterium]
MKYIFFGSPEFAKIVFKKLLDAGYVPTAVVCNPDRPAGRKKIITPPPVKQLIENGKWQIEILQPENLSAISDKLLAIRPDLFIVAAYAKIIKKEILDIPKLGTIGTHPSLLPKHRGSSPIQTAILDNDEKTGVTLYLMDEKMDNGPILANRKSQIANSDTYEILMRKLAELGGDLLIETLPKFIACEKRASAFGSGNTSGFIPPRKGHAPMRIKKLCDIPLQEQNHSQATFTKKFTTQDAFIEPDKLEKAINIGGETAIKIYNKIRALNPEPGTWTIKTPPVNGKRMKILEAELTDDKKLKLKTIQFESGKPRPF